MENDTFLKTINKCDINIIADIVDIFFSSAENQKFYKNIFRKDVAKISRQKTLLDQIGYETMMIFVNTSLEVALERSAARDRVLPEKLVTKISFLILIKTLILKKLLNL